MEPNDVHSPAVPVGSSTPHSNQVWQFLSYINDANVHALTRTHTPISNTLNLKSQPLTCPVTPECSGISFARQQELERHLQSQHLPFWIFCPHPGCRWRGARVDNFHRHLNTEVRPMARRTAISDIQREDDTEFDQGLRVAWR